MRTTEILEAWDLHGDADLEKYSMRNWKDLARAFEQSYDTAPTPVLGSTHLGTTQGIRIAEGSVPAANLVVPLLTSNTVWLPDPVFSFFSSRAAEAWACMPDSPRSHYFVGPAGSPYAHWTAFWQVPIDQRKNRIRKVLPPILQRMNDLKPLVEIGAVAFYPWELLLLREREQIRDISNSMANSPEVRRTTQQLLQQDYNLGIRVGALGVEASADSSDGLVKKGDPMYCANKVPMLVLAMLNAGFSRDTASSFISPTPGDRLVYDLVRANLAQTPVPSVIAESVRLPALEAALWDDIVAIRQHSDSLQALRTVVSKVAGIPEERGLPAIRAELEEAASKLAADSSIWRRIGNQTTDISVATVLPTLAATAAEGVTAGAVAGLGGAALGFLLSLRRAYVSPERQEAGASSELLIRVADRL
jgi:hypothetical protein